MSDYLRRIVARTAPGPVPAALQPTAPRRWGGNDPFLVEPSVAVPPPESETRSALTADRGADGPGDRRPVTDDVVQVPIPARSVRRRSPGVDRADDDGPNDAYGAEQPSVIEPVERPRSPRPSPRSDRMDDGPPPAEPIEPAHHRSLRSEGADDDPGGTRRSIVRLETAPRPVTARTDPIGPSTNLADDLQAAPRTTEGAARAVRPMSPATPAAEAAGRGVRPMIVAPSTRASPPPPAPARIVIGRISVVVASGAPQPSAPPRQPTTRPRTRRATTTGTAHGGSSGSASRFTHRFGIGQL